MKKPALDWVLLFLLLGLNLGNLYFCNYAITSKRGNLYSVSPQTEKVPPTFSKAVIIIIDGLRLDSILPCDSRSVPYLNQLSSLYDLYDNEPLNTRIYSFKGHFPSMTVNRLLLLFTGLWHQLEDNGFVEDNIFKQVKLSNKTSVLVGGQFVDDIFPGEFTMKAVTNDFDIDDVFSSDKIAQKIFPQFIRENKADLYVAYLIGMDHLHHLVGLNHPSIKDSLTIFNDIISEVLGIIDDQTVLMILGDHGSTPNGSHGDNEDEENTGLVIYSKKRTFDTSIDMNNITQVDLESFVPTFATLFGVSIPFQSLGVLIEEFFQNKTQNINAMRNNAMQISRFYSYLGENTKFPLYKTLKNLFDLAEALYGQKDYHKAYDMYRMFMVRVKSAVYSHWTSFPRSNLLYHFIFSLYTNIGIIFLYKNGSSFPLLFLFIAFTVPQFFLPVVPFIISTAITFSVTAYFILKKTKITLGLILSVLYALFIYCVLCILGINNFSSMWMTLVSLVFIFLINFRNQEFINFLCLTILLAVIFFAVKAASSYRFCKKWPCYGKLYETELSTLTKSQVTSVYIILFVVMLCGLLYIQKIRIISPVKYFVMISLAFVIIFNIHYLYFFDAYMDLEFHRQRVVSYLFYLSLLLAIASFICNYWKSYKTKKSSNIFYYNTFVAIFVVFCIFINNVLTTYHFLLYSIIIVIYFYIIYKYNLNSENNINIKFSTYFFDMTFWYFLHLTFFFASGNDHSLTTIHWSSSAFLIRGNHMTLSGIIQSVQMASFCLFGGIFLPFHVVVSPPDIYEPMSQKLFKLLCTHALVTNIMIGASMLILYKKNCDSDVYPTLLPEFLIDILYYITSNVISISCVGITSFLCNERRIPLPK